jgi:hypothetical protein
MSRRSVTVAAAIIFVGVGWFGLRQYRRHIDCQQRNAAFERRIETIKQDAHEQLKIGTRKADVNRFFIGHGIPFDITRSEAIGTLNTTGGCAPLGCGTDRALIGVRVKIDADGTVTGEPVVIGMYVDCV